ncbi:MAG: hypothetical protein QOJ58_5058 [Alphaproteobacteria bacterium]|jgi:hypothetical protein|nr:hypothetical protein [Alphaproteobacteria bacterium]
MAYVTVGKENGANIDIYYKDWGKGRRIVFSHKGRRESVAGASGLARPKKT